MISSRSLIQNFTILALTALAGVAGAQARYRVTELRPLAGYTESVAFGMNDLGDVVGLCQTPTSSGSMATVWKGSGTPAALGRAQKGIYSEAWAINNSGVIAGIADDGDFRPNVVVFIKGVAAFIDGGSNNSRVAEVLNNGQIVGNYLKGFGPNSWLPTMWSQDKPDRYRHLFLPPYIGPIGGSTSVFANGANNLGAVVGQVSSSTEWSSRAGMWKSDSNHTLTLLDPLPGEWDSYAFDINDNGFVTGVSDTGSFSTTPVIWSSDALHIPIALPLLPGEVSGMATKINNLNQVIGSHGPNSAPAIWINGQLIDPQQFLDSSGAGWTITVLYGINNRGQITGLGTHNGQIRGFVLSPVAP